ncbi:MAG: ERF family protein [Candidatus Caldatribacteriota bacterium]
MIINKKLLNIQSKLKAPKNQRNNFGNYNYRNCEDILEAVKPLLLEEGCTLYIVDEIENIGERYYVKATVNFIDIESGENIITSAFAREEENKKGMDSSQITGASSSYARKYALNGLFCIDDNKDSDTTNTGDTKKDKDEKVSDEDKKKAKKLENAIKEIDKLVNELAKVDEKTKLPKVQKEVIADTIKKHFNPKGKPSANYNAIKDIDVATKVYKALKELEVK